MVQFESGNPFAMGSQSWFTQLSELSSIQKGLQDILLHILIALGDTLLSFSQGSHFCNSSSLPGFPDAIG
jgi:hypothetical protein